MQTENQTCHVYRSWEAAHWFHRRVAAALARGLGVLLAAVILAAPAVSSANGGQPWIQVDVEALTLTVLSAENRVLARFNNISIGSGGAAEIHRQGDETTPLGVFHIAWIDRASRYGTFYGFDYPSERVARSAYAKGILSRVELDAILEAARSHRLPPQNTSLGGYLGIHGIGRSDAEIHEGFNWTNGCVALTNQQIRQLSHWVRIGTQVVIH
ncbi:MAG: L,D-transpeptidase [Thiobacillus sp.]|jgi:murein L,D-transpeptidase YafK|uniref:L,D-transpeptidase family protein n=1 Tax=Thiobacillus sp. TaxID=924 RepID=UPI002894A31A|nr:L,D-transpeptidase [Thiobacillus sp.]MDT3706112.1 L,D-transpeptidase [Thiobacillus sp.]